MLNRDKVLNELEPLVKKFIGDEIYAVTMRLNVIDKLVTYSLVFNGAKPINVIITEQVLSNSLSLGSEKDLAELISEQLEEAYSKRKEAV